MAVKTVLCLTVLCLALTVGFVTSVQGAQKRAQISELEDCLAECNKSLGQSGAEMLGECKGGCYHSDAMRIRNPDKCDIVLQEKGYGGMAGYKNCVTDVAAAVRDYTICRRIPEPLWRGECLERLAVETGNTAACIEIPKEYSPTVSIEAVRNKCRQAAERPLGK